MMLWILGVVGLLLIWGGGYVLAMFGYPLALWLQVLLTVLVVLLVVGVLLYRRWRAGAAARAIERELMRQAEQQAASARPDRRAEILQLNRQMQEGIAALKKSRLGARGGGSALYALPWYAIIGPPGAGKTTALRHSGLSFPFLDPSKGGGVRGSGGTRNCDWWFTNEAILLDTAGRYATDEDDREEWLAFLATLKKYRKKAPINGVIVAVALPDLIDGDGQKALDTARRLRARIDEVMTRLDVVLPVYLMFTKADLVSGFVECWGDLRKSERDQVFGCTFTLDGRGNEDPAGAFSEEFANLVSAVHGRALHGMSAVRQTALRQRIFQYPLEFGALKDPLSHFVGQLFQRNTFQENPVFRGFYFSSGTQEGKPIDRVISGMARAFGLHLPAVEAPTEPKSYFVTDLFRRVIFPDQHLVERTASARLRDALVRLAFITGALLLSALLLGPGGCSYARNQTLISDTAAVAKTAGTITWGPTRPTVSDIGLLDPAANQLRTLREWRDHGAPLAYQWGMYAGNALYPGLRDAYVAELDAGFKKPTHAELTKLLAALGRLESMPPGQYGAHYTRLKLYLMMSNPAERLDVEWAVPRLVDAWRAAVHSGPSPEVDAMRPHIELYTMLLKAGEIAPWGKDDVVVGRARTVLLRAPQLERMYEAMVSDANTTIPPIRKETIFYGSVAPLVKSKADKQVEGAYTKQGWNMVRDLLESKASSLASEQWVLGEGATSQAGEIESQVARLRSIYFERYKGAWRDFLLDMEVEQPKDATVALDELNILSEPEWPYQRLIRILRENVTLEVEQPGTDLSLKGMPKIRSVSQAKAQGKKAILDAINPGDDATEKEAPPRTLSPVEHAFKPMVDFGGAEGSEDPKAAPAAPSGLQQYQDQLAKLVGVLSDLKEGKPDVDTTKVAKDFETAFRAANELLTSQTGFTRPLLAPYLLRPITGAWTGVVNDSGSAASGLWEVSVWDKWREKLAGKYPFTKAQQDATIEDFSEFFRPETGLLWGFFNENLSSTLAHEGDAFIPKRRFQSSVAYTGPFLSNCLARGNKITKGTFPEGSETPVVAFDVNLHSVSPDVSEIMIEIDGVSNTYRNTPQEWLSTQWPAPEAKSRGARVRIRGYSGLDEVINRPGAFGIFRLLDAANEIKPGTAGGRASGTATLVATWYVRSESTFFKLDIRPAKADTATSSSLFLGYDCPRVIAHQGGG
ncbi:MAG: type VI secretion system membrane subunit TssM [Polyangiaceae bacterium]|nr:type VI secretion system membrane subunit TssM [Polyangiaceae bacterium]